MERRYPFSWELLGGLNEGRPTLGRYARLPLDTESVRHGRTMLGFKGSSAQVMKKVKRHFEPVGDQAFRSYWFEMWTFYESKHGPAWTWERDTTGRMFTAALLK